MESLDFLFLDSRMKELLIGKHACTFICGYEAKIGLMYGVFSLSVIEE
jgi:hypothetical protein